MLDLRNFNNTSLEIILIDGQKINLGLPSQRLLKKLSPLVDGLMIEEVMNLPDIPEFFDKIIEVSMDILNLNKEGIVFNIDYVENLNSKHLLSILIEFTKFTVNELGK